MTAALWALVALPALTGTVLLVAGRRADAVAAPCAVASAVAGLALAGAVAATRPAAAAPALAGIPANLAVDGLSAVMVLTVTAVHLAVVLFASGELGSDEARARFFGFMSLFAAAMLVTVTATGLLVLLAAWEVMGAVSYALIGYWWRGSERVRSAGLAFLTTRAGDLGLYLAAGAALAGGAGALQLSGLAGLEGVWRDAAVAGVVVAALGKSAQLPFSFWLSHAMAGPSPVSALLHSATMVAAGGYLLVRVEPALAAAVWAGPLVAWVGAATAVLLGVVALAQSDLKQLLAASTCAQIGFIVLGAGTGGVAGASLQFTAHAAAKSLLFLCAGAWLVTLGARDLEGLRGAARRHPLVGAAFTAGALAVAGVPPTGIWAAKDAVLAAALRSSPALYATGLAAAALAAAYAARALVAVWAPALPRSRPHGGEHGRGPAKARRSPGAAPSVGGRAPADGTRPAVARASLRVPLLALAVGSLALGVLALPAAAHWWRALLDVPGERGPAGWEMAASALVSVVVLVGAGLVFARGSARAAVAEEGGAGPGTPARAGNGVASGTGLPPVGRWAADWLGLERLVRGGLVRPTLALSRGLSVFDDRVVAGGVRAGARLGLTAADAVRDRVETAADRSVGAVASAVRTAARWALRPQTGLLHQYYAQAVVALLVLATVFVLMR
ncbi:NADH-quinone oxidoreductase subunit 5 family protein [Nocardiopsis aegyptia]|uniref:NADH:ubiquinone oxidoreductase subunit 5 (Subunit L)/multisubunit Na+/H+ antiporter MnhA subunit n=1 Tax=Nocardiopsis aegyptia TaxID=220378 RepID=A0A7Z0JDN6_9ACTN|nr:proton-conducting transporter membrane subunit [Nocardiopsis aegyptia]NYJ37680.1 NADH:ubiquinone oxidoreductase subunit 5 (subunit L)/multisubunit Na+/H+ antiporter MnhA subunit [Nocardiopsis aegyptia]